MRCKQRGLDESAFVSGGVLKQQISGGRWDDHKLAVVWLTHSFWGFFVGFFSLLSCTTLQILI